ncbi:protease modulator HflC [Candidatus Tokpelaia sp.]|uniref:protease modulator HflC n=1 Tax=Candidatus Tokpelaia sp. TaxID=2233777 RepID=UPI00123AD086|nr:protease modulator HflC [Candidatus Tokpelaia sp.]KAA6405892.1 protease modulator HflC [Candidatus Tokpelaia sp.]
MRRFPLIIGFYLILAALFLAWLTVFIVYPRQQIAVKRFGQIMRVETVPGLYFKLPFIDQMVIIDDRLRRYDLPTKTVQVRGGAFYEVDAFFTYRITNARLFLQKVASGQPSTAEEVNLAPRFDDALRAVYGQRDFSAALSSARADMMQEVKQQIAGDAQSLGITIIDVRIRRTDLTKAVSQRTFERMRQEREAVAEQLRARGNEEKDKIIAAANREYEEIIAAATRDADIMRGEGEAGRIDILRDAIAVDPEFYMFWRSMDAYKKIKNLPMIIAPDSVFFKYLKTPDGQ